MMQAQTLVLTVLSCPAAQRAITPSVSMPSHGSLPLSNSELLEAAIDAIVSGRYTSVRVISSRY